MTCPCSIAWPEEPCSKIAHMYIGHLKWHGLNHCWVSLAGSKLIWTYAYVTLTCNRPSLNILKVEHGMSCNSFMTPWYQNDTYYLLDFKTNLKWCTNQFGIKMNCCQPSLKARDQMLMVCLALALHLHQNRSMKDHGYLEPGIALAILGVEMCLCVYVCGRPSLYRSFAGSLLGPLLGALQRPST